MSVLSPITHKPAKFIEAIPSSLIAAQYEKEVDMDVSAYFQSLPEIQLYECQQTGYRFFYPFTLAGDAAFYEQLQRYEWYYAPWKWDYDVALPYIDTGAKVLDIGCGAGNFLTHIRQHKNCDCTGLEFNNKAVETARAKGLTIYKETIQQHAETHEEIYDIVCYFQVLEHIDAIDPFVAASIKTLKKGGKLIICVPNNNPYFFQYFKYHSLNMPPHHMGLWNKRSFEALTNIYPIKLKEITEQRLSRYRFFTKLYIKSAAGGNMLKKLALTALYPVLFSYFLAMGKNIKGGNILAVYTKV